ncbi:hypothetical protein HDC35_000888 [Sphingopyxis sp. JAI128]|nr:hypothetical protein [Sphingopyxis sp. JAI128]
MPRLWPDPRDNSPEPKFFLWAVVVSGIGYYLLSWWPR